MNEILPHKTIYPSNTLDSDSIALIRSILPNKIVKSDKLEEGGSQSDIDGYLEICDAAGYARAKITVQIKHLTLKKKPEEAYYDIPSELYGYADIHKGEVVVFIACDTENERFFWKAISLDDIIRIKESDKGLQKTYRCHFSKDEICSASTVNDTISAWRELYNQKMASIQDDKKLAEDFAALQKSYFNIISTQLHGISDSHIVRHQVDEIKEWISNSRGDGDARICLLVGDAGVGKSAVLKEVVDSLNPDTCRSLCIKADAIDDFGNNITLEKMRGVIEFYSIGKKDILLFIDQIDALSQCMSNDRGHLNVMMTLLSSLENWSNVRAIVSCRNYDLNYDSDLCILKNKAHLIEIGNLTDNEVAGALEKVEAGLWDKLDDATFRMLKTVQYLNAFCILYKRRSAGLHFGNPIELYDAIWEEYICKSPNHIDSGTLEDTLYLIANSARSAGTLRPILTPATTQKRSFDYLASSGLINIDGNSVSFFHQSFYEYILARQYAYSGKSLVDDFKNDFQGLELRPIVKAVLEYERSHNGVLFVEEVRSILSSESVRFHVKLLAISVLASIQEPQLPEMQLIKDFCKKDNRLLVYFLRGVQADGWFATVSNIVKPVLADLTKDSPICFPLTICLSKFVFEHPENVYELVNRINDSDTRLFSTAYILSEHNDYGKQCVLDAYREIRPHNRLYSIELIKDALLTNEKFALEEAEISLVNYFTSKKEKYRNDEYELFKVLFPLLLEKRPKDFLLTINSAIVNIIKQSSYDGLYGFSRVKAFDDFSLDGYSKKLLTIYEELLTKFSSDLAIMRPIIGRLMELRNETSISMAFSAMAANPKAYDEQIRQIIADEQSVNMYLASDIEFFYMKMVKSWYLNLDAHDAVMYQKKVLSFKSPVDLYYDREHSLDYFLCPHLWRSKWDLICNTLPEDGLIPEMKKCSQELLRRFGRRTIVKRPEDSMVVTYYGGGLVSNDTYSRFSLENWLNSFLKLDESRSWRSHGRPFDLEGHADAFEKCVSANPNKFRDFIQGIASNNDVRPIYKVAGIKGLLAGVEDPLSLWNLAEPYISVEYAKTNSSSFKQIAEYFVKSENPYLDKIIAVAETIAALPSDEHDCIYEDDTNSVERRASKLIEQAINSYQGRSVELLIQICSLPERKSQIYGILSKLQAGFSESLKTLPLYLLYVKCAFDESLYFHLMKELLAGLGPEALFIRAGAIQHCFYCKNEIVKEYIDRIEADPVSHKILAQIYFYGLRNDKPREDCRLRLEKILSYNEEDVIVIMIQTAMESFDDSEMREYSAELLRRFSTDDRDSVVKAYCEYCNRLPVEAFGFYCDITKTLPRKKNRMIHDQLEYLQKCISRYPEKCCRFILDQKYSEIEGQWNADNDVVRVLLQIYNKLRENGDEESINEIMDLFDDYIYRGNSVVMDAVGKMN